MDGYNLQFDITHKNVILKIKFMTNNKLKTGKIFPKKDYLDHFENPREAKSLEDSSD